MTGSRCLGDLERAVMEQLWDSDQPQTVREVHAGIRTRRTLAYTTVMTVLHRLAAKDLVLQIRDDRAYQYTPAQSREELVAGVMVDALDQLPDPDARHHALLTVLARLGSDEIEAVRLALSADTGNRPGSTRPRVA